MPSQVNVQGKVTRRPGVYAHVDASALNNKELDVNNVAVLGDFPFLEKAVPAPATSVRGLADLQYSDSDLPMLASLLYNPSVDGKVPGGPNKVYLVNVKPTTQAGQTFPDQNGIASLDVKSRVWGNAGNRILFSIDAGSQSGTKYTAKRDGRVEEFDNVGLPGIISFQYTGNVATAASMIFDGSSLVIVNKKSGLNLTFSPSQMAFDGVLKMTMSVALGAAETVDLTITGINKATGSLEQEIIPQFVQGDLTKTSVKAWSGITEITASVVGFGGTWEIEANAFDLSTDDYAFAQDFVDTVNSATGFTAITEEPQAGAIPTGNLDTSTVADVSLAAGLISADAHAAVVALANSQIVTATQSAGPSLGPAALLGTVVLSGGTEASAQLSDWTDALESIETESVQIIAALPSNLLDVTGISGVHGAVRDHCKHMAGVGSDERNAWVGSEKDDTEAENFARTKKINSRFVSLVFQDITVVDPTGNSRNLSPSWLAVLMAGMQSGTSIGTPLTRKRPNVVSADQNSNIKPTQSASDLLGKGLCFLTQDRLGLKVERSITTYMTDDNPIWSEMSANESVNTSIRDLRANLDTMIGDPGVITTATRIKSLALARLNRQVADGIIKAFLKESVAIEDIGDTFRVTYTMAAIEPVNFIVVTATVKRIAGVA